MFRQVIGERVTVILGHHQLRQHHQPLLQYKISRLWILLQGFRVQDKDSHSLVGSKWFSSSSQHLEIHPQVHPYLQ